MRHGGKERHVGARLLGQPERGPVDHLHPPGIHDDELGAVVGHRRLHLQRNDRMSLGRVGAGHEKNVAVNDLGGGVAHGRGADRHLQRDHRAGMAQAGAVIHVIGAEQGAEQLLQEIVVLVGCLGAAVDRHGVCAIALENLDQPAGGVIEGLVPRDLAPLVAVEGLGARAGRLRCLANERRRHPVLVVNEVVAEASFDAQVAVVDHRVKRRRHFVDVVVLDMQLQVASHAAVGTCGRDDAIGRDHGDFLRRFFPPLVACITCII